MSAYDLSEQFVDLTDEMHALKAANRAHRAELLETYKQALAALHARERALAAQRNQVALRMTQTGHGMDELGRMVGVSGPFICQLARKAREENANAGK